MQLEGLLPWLTWREMNDNPVLKEKLLGRSAVDRQVSFTGLMMECESGGCESGGLSTYVMCLYPQVRMHGSFAPLISLSTFPASNFLAIGGNRVSL